MAVQIQTNETGKATELTGDQTVNGFIDPSPNEYLIVKGMLIGGQGNTGECRIETSEGRLLLVLYNSIQNQIAPAGRTHIDLNPGESIKLLTTGRGPGDKTFFGVSVERQGVES